MSAVHPLTNDDTAQISWDIHENLRATAQLSVRVSRASQLFLFFFPKSPQWLLIHLYVIFASGFGTEQDHGKVPRIVKYDINIMKC